MKLHLAALMLTEGKCDIQEATAGVRAELWQC